jgi:hypothetical protein
MYTANPAIYGDTGGTQSGQLCVLKEFKMGSVYEESFFKDDIRAVDKAAEIIQAFNHLFTNVVWTGKIEFVFPQKDGSLESTSSLAGSLPGCHWKAQEETG